MIRRDGWVCLFLAVVMVLSLTTVGRAQKGMWVPYQRPGGLPAPYFRAAGENCVAFTGTNDNTLTVYDVVSGEWRNHTMPAMQPWLAGPATDGNVVLAFNSTLAVGYSALTQTFANLTYLGARIGYADGFGCRGNMAFFVTSERIYVFDAGTGLWYNYAYTPPTPDSSKILITVGSGPNHMAFVLSNQVGMVERTFVGYSYLTKTFTEYAGDYLKYDFLRDGFVFHTDSAYGDPAGHFVAGYDAQSGSYATVLTPNPVAMSRSEFAFYDDIGNGYLWRSVDATLGGGMYRFNLIGFDAEQGTFTETYYDYTSACDVNCPGEDLGTVGRDLAYATEILFSQGNALDYHTYDRAAHSFSTLSTPLEYSVGVPNCIVGSLQGQAGGGILMGWDCTTLMGYDVASELSASTALPALVPGGSDYLRYSVKGDWGVYLCQRTGSQILHMYSYSGENNHITDVSVMNDIQPLLYDSTNIFAMFTHVPGGSNQIRMYSPGTDTCLTRNLYDREPSIRYDRDFVLFYDPDLFSAQIVFFDGVTGEEMMFPFGWTTPLEFTNNTYRNSSMFLAYNTAGRQIGYSTYTRTSSEISTRRATSRQGVYDIVVMVLESDVPNRDILTYNSLYNSFVPLSLSSQQGVYSSLQMGRRTALMITTNGWLLAFDPERSSPTAVDDEPGAAQLPQTLEVSQNYPNPFNPATRFDFNLPARSEVEVVVYNSLGQKVRVLLNTTLPAGEHHVTWDGRDASGAPVASGVYFYRVNAGDYYSTRKMVLMK